jgi:hypothetical protein
VSPASTTTALNSDVNPSAVGQLVTFTATVSGPFTPTGSVNFMEGITLLGTETLVGGVATFSIDTLAFGPHDITAVYSGDVNWTTSTSDVLTQNVRHGTTTTLEASAATSTHGTSVTFTVTVTGTGTVTGDVVFMDGATNLGTRTLAADGTATLSTSTLTAGSHSITAHYQGDGNHLVSSSAILVHMVTKANPTITLGSNVNPVGFGQPVTFTATVSGAGLAPTGSVTFRDGAIILGTRTVSAGVATFTTSTLSSGAHSITATYNGDLNYNLRTSAAFAQNVTVPPAVLLQATVFPAFGVGINSPFTISVTARDQFGNVASGHNASVTLVLLSAPVGGTLTGTLTKTFTGGLVSFSDLRVTKGGSYVIRIISGGLVTDVVVTTIGRRV